MQLQEDYLEEYSYNSFHTKNEYYFIKSYDTFCYEFRNSSNELISAISFLSKEEIIEEWAKQCKRIELSI